MSAGISTNYYAVRIVMSTDTGSAVSKQKLQDLKIRMLALKEHL